MKVIWDNISAELSKVITQKYSTSFSLSINFLSKKFRDPVYAIYGFVRISDEIVDSFHDFDKKHLLNKLRNDTLEAIDQRISINPVLNNFQKIVHKYNIEWNLIDLFLKSMEMDLEKKDHDPISYGEYILGSAEVVGLMCLRVFTEGDFKLYETLKPYAMKLGSAFQKVNFLRDINYDFKGLGRSYFPGVDFTSFSKIDKEKIQDEIAGEFNAALQGIRMLPASSKRGVFLAYYYYKKLFYRIKLTPAEKVLHTRIRVPDHIKIGLMFKCFLRAQMNLL